MAAGGARGAGSRPRANGHVRGGPPNGTTGWRALGRTGGPLRRRPLAPCLRLAAGLESLAALHAREARTGYAALNQLDEGDTVRLATGASLFAAAGRPQLRVGALVTATLAHSLRVLALTLQPETQRRNERLAVELAMSATLGGLLRQAVRAARWER